MQRHYRILFVCTGNICRSPMAEGLLRVKMSGDAVLIESAGTHALLGNEAAPHALSAAETLGANIRKHRARQLTHQLAISADVILVMASDHKTVLDREFPEVRGRVFLLGEFGRTGTVEAPDVQDPYGSNLDVYARCAKRINDELDRILPVLKENIANRNRAHDAS